MSEATDPTATTPIDRTATPPLDRTGTPPLDRTGTGTAAPAESLLVVPWSDPVVDDLGLDPRSDYAESFWLPLLGPTSTWLLRRMAAEFDLRPDGFSIPAADVARSIGIGTRGGQRGPFHRAVERCVRFGLAHRGDHDILAVRRRLPPLTRAQVQQLPRTLRTAHDQWQTQRRATATRVDGEHAARLARSLLDVGASRHDVDEQLRRWGFDDTAARRALRTAEAAVAGRLHAG